LLGPLLPPPPPTPFAGEILNAPPHISETPPLEGRLVPRAFVLILFLKHFLDGRPPHTPPLARPPHRDAFSGDDSSACKPLFFFQLVNPFATTHWSRHLPRTCSLEITGLVPLPGIPSTLGLSMNKSPCTQTPLPCSLYSIYAPANEASWLGTPVFHSMPSMVPPPQGVPSSSSKASRGQPSQLHFLHFAPRCPFPPNKTMTQGLVVFGGILGFSCPRNCFNCQLPVYIAFPPRLSCALFMGS